MRLRHWLPTVLRVGKVMIDSITAEAIRCGVMDLNVILDVERVKDETQ